MSQALESITLRKWLEQVFRKLVGQENRMVANSLRHRYNPYLDVLHVGGLKRVNLDFHTATPHENTTVNLAQVNEKTSPEIQSSRS